MLNIMNLNNGITVITEKNLHLNSVNLAFYFNAGIIYESKKINGISHLVEHLFFRNLNGISQKDLYFKMESIGTTLRAKTYVDFVCFDMTVAPKYFDDAFEILIQLLSKHHWSKEDIDLEKAVVKKQIDFKDLNNFSQFVDDNYFVGTNMKMPIMGSVQSVEQLTVSKINSWKETFFNSNNVCCVLTGNFSDDNFNNSVINLEAVDNSYTLIPIKSNVFPRNFCDRTLKSDIVVETDWEISDISLTFDIDTEKNKDVCVNLISSMLGEGVGARLPYILREKEPVTDEIYSKVDTFLNTKRITIELSVQNIDLEKSLILLFLEIVKFKSGIKQRDLDSSITFFTENQKFIYDSARDYNFFLGWNGFVNKKDTNIDSIIQNYKNTTIDELNTSINNIFSSANLIITVTNNNQIYKKTKLKKLLQSLRNKLNL